MRNRFMSEGSAVILVPMSKDALAVVRRGYDAFGELDMDRFIADWHPEIVWDVSGYDGWPGGSAVYTGTDDILSEFANLMTHRGGVSIDDLRLSDLGGGRVLALYRESFRDRDTGDARLIEVGILYEVADGMVERADVFTGHDNARRASALACRSAT
jgi:ketosteroid isomerase-like protein